MNDYNEEDVQWLYGRMQDDGVDTGTLDDFKESLKNDADRDWYFKRAKKMGLDVGDAAEFKSWTVKPSYEDVPYSWEGQKMMPSEQVEQRVMTDASGRHASKQPQQQAQPQQQPQQAAPKAQPKKGGVPSWKAMAGMQLVANQSRTRAITSKQPRQKLTGNTLKMDQGKRAGVVDNNGRAEVQTARQQRVERSAEKMSDPNMIVEQMLTTSGGKQGDEAVANIQAQLPEHYEWLSSRLGESEANDMLKQNLMWRSMDPDMERIYNEEKEAQAARESEATSGLGLGADPENHFLDMYISETARRRAGDESGTLDRMLSRALNESAGAREWINQRVNELTPQMGRIQALAQARNELRNMFRDRDVRKMMPGGDGMFVVGSAASQNLWARFGRWAISAGSGDYESDRMIDEAFDLYRQEQASMGARIAAPVATLVTDIVGGGFYPAGAAAKGVTWLGSRGLMAAGTRIFGIGAEQAGRRVLGNWGVKLALSSLGGAANFGVYEMESEALTGLGQGTFDWGDVGHAGLSGGVKGLIFGVVGGGMGQITADLTGGAAVLGELATISAEGTVFTAMDVWETGELTPESVGTSFGMVLGGRAAHPGEYVENMYARIKGNNGKNAPKTPPRINQETYQKLVDKGYNGIAELLKDSSFAKDIYDAMRGKRVNAGNMFTDGEAIAIDSKNYEQERAKTNLNTLANELEAMKNDPDVDWQTLRKAEYVLNGKFAPEPIAMGYRVDVDDNGRGYGYTLDTDGRVINSFKLKNGEERRAWEAETSRKVDINALGLAAETVRTEEMCNAVARALYEGAAEKGISPKDAIDAWNKPAKERTEEEKALIKEAEGRARELLEKNGSYADRAAEIVEDKYGVKIDDLLKRPVNKRSDAEQSALEELMQRLNGTYNDAKDKSDAELVQDEKDKAHDDGYNVEDERKNELRQRLDATRQKLKDLGYSDDFIDWVGENDAAAVADRLNELNYSEDIDAAMEYIKAKAAFDGMVDRIDEKIDDAVKASNEEVDKRVNPEERGGDGKITTVTLKDKRRVNITGGRLTVKDGAVDKENSDKFLTARDEETGEPLTVDIGDIIAADEPVDPEQLKQESGQAIAEGIARQESHLIDGDMEFKEGDQFQIGDVTVTVVGSDGENVTFLQGDNPHPVTRSRHELSEVIKNSASAVDKGEADKNGVAAVDNGEGRMENDADAAPMENTEEPAAATEEQDGVAEPNPQETVAYYRASGMSEKRIDKVVANNKAAAEERLAEAQKAWDETKETDEQVLDELERAVDDAKEEVEFWTEVERIKDATKEPENAIAPEPVNEMKPIEEPAAEIGDTEKPAEAGIAESERVNWEDVDKETTEILNSLAKELGITVRAEEMSEQERGYFEPSTNEIVVNKNLSADDRVVFALGHELTHGLEKAATDASMFGVFEAYKKAALEMRKILVERDGGDYNDYLVALADRYANHEMWRAYNEAIDAGRSVEDAMRAAKAAYNKVDEAYVEKEITCDITGEMMKNPELARDVFAKIQEKSKLRQIKDWFVGLYNRLRGKAPKGMEKRWQDLADKFETAYKEVITERKEEAMAEAAEAKAEEEGVHSMEQAAAVDGKEFSIRNEDDLEDKLRKYAKTTDGKRLKWNADKINDVIHETADLIRSIHAALSGDPFYDEFAAKDPTIRVDWRDGEEHPVVTWSRNNVEYKYDMSADLLCVNNDGLEEVLSSPAMCDLMVKMFENEVAKNGGKNYTVKKVTDKETGEVTEKKEYIAGGFTSEDYINLYNMLRDMGFVVPCRGCFDAAARLKMLPSVSQKFENLVNDIIMERNEDPDAYDEKLRQLGREMQENENARAKAKGEKPKRKVGTNGFPLMASTKEEAIRVAVAADDLRNLVTYSQLMSAQGQTEMLSDWGSLFRAWQRTGAGRPKDKLLPEPYTGDIVNSTYTIIGPADKKTPNFRDIEVNQGTSLRRNSHSELRPYLAIDEIQFMRDAFVRNLCVFKYMKELDDVRLFGQLGVKFNMSFFPAYDKNGVAAGLDANGEYIAAEESVGAREFPYIGEDGKQHYDGMKGWEEAQKYCNDDVSLSTVIFSVPHMLKVLTDVPTPDDPSGKWGSAIPFHSSGASAKQLFLQGLGWVRAEDSKHPFEEEAYTDWDKGVTNFEQVQNDRFGDGWVAVGGKNDGKDMAGHKLEFATASHYYNADLDLHMFSGALVKGEAYKDLKFNKDGTPNKASLKSLKGATPLNIDYNDKVRELNTDYGYKDAADYYIQFMQENGIVPRFHFVVPEKVFLEACRAGGVDPHDPKLGWKGEGNDWTPIDSPAYYSMFCDYGMTKADGKWSPQRPVGFINEKGEREFRMPDNTVEIVSDAMRRYTERRTKENEMVGEAERRFADMMVEQGKLTREQADEALSKTTFSERDSRSQGRSYSLTEEEKSGVKFSLVEDPEEIKRLDNEKLLEGFRNVSMQEDGTMRSPMADRLSSKGTEKRPTSPFEFRRWERSDENPDLATDDGKINLGKPNGLGSVDNVDYNPYIHIRPTTVNKQFKNAWERDDLVYIRTLYPESELSSGYHAEKAKKPVGLHDWNGGELILSRWDKPVEVVPWEEVADAWVEEFKERGVEFDIVPPKLLPILMERGVEILPPHKGMGKACNDAYREKVLGENPENPDEGTTPGGGRRYALVNAISRIRKGEIEQLAKEISEDRSGNAEDKLVVRLSKTTPEERKALVKAISEESNGAQSELAERAKAIQEMDAIRIEQKVVSMEDLKRMIAENDGRVIIDDDGMNVSFTTRSFDKLYNQVVLESGVANEIIKLLGSSKYAYSQPHNNAGQPRKDPTKAHPERENALEYRNYVVKFENDEGKYYCRFIVMRTTDGDNRSHGAVISDIAISKENAFDTNTEGENGNLLGSSSPHSMGRMAGSVLIPDAKLDNFFEIANTGQQKFPESFYEIPLKEGNTSEIVQGNSRQYSLSEESDKLFKGAKEKFGITNDIREAGYVLPDGTMLDFSGRHELNPGTDSSFLKGRRATDHRAINQIGFVYDENGDEVDTGLETDMPDFIKRGAIRIDNNAGTINLATKPTKEQRNALRQLIAGNDGDVGVDFGDGWDSDHYVEYTGARHTRVLGDIDRYFDEGIKPSDYSRSYSLSEELESYQPRGSQLEQNLLARLFDSVRENKERVDLRKNAMREANRQLAELNEMFEGVDKDWDYHRGTASARRGIATAQREYDQWTVDKLVGLAKEMLKSGLYKDLTPYETQRLVGLINKAAGKDDITKQANSVFDILAKHQIKEWDKVLQKLLRVRANKLNQQGVRVQGQLDKAGQTMIRTLKDAMAMDEHSLADAINDCRSRMGEDNKQIADNAANEYVGYMLAQQYHDGIKKTDAMMAALRAERREVESEVYDIWREPKTDQDGNIIYRQDGEPSTIERRRLKPEFGGLDEDGNRQSVSEENKARRKQVDATLASIDRGMRKLMVEQIDNYRRMTDALGGDVAASITRAKEWIERDKERIGEIHHAANSDLLNVEEELTGKDRSKEKGVANWGAVRFVGTPLGTFEKYLRYFGKRSAYGEGRLFNKFMGGFTECTHNEWDNYNRGLKEMNKKCEELFGCSWQRLMAKMRGGTFNKVRGKLGGDEFPPVKVSYWVEGKRVEDRLNQDEVAYLIACSKMLDGEMKLNRMGIDADMVEQLRQQVDPRLLQLADWYQHEFLPKQRERYNEVYERMFGAPMAHIDNYIHLNINERGRGDKRELNERTMESDSPSSVTGSIKERRVNVLPIDLHTSILDLALGEHQKMERWAAWAEFSRDVSDLLKYKKFQNKVRNLKSVEFGSGDQLWDEFQKTALIATGDYKGEGPRNKLEKGFANAAKLVSSSCINFKVHTALKQLLSFPAFMSDARPGDLISAASNPKGTWEWAIENLPGFAKRWQSRRVGDTRLMDTDSDYSFWRNRWVKGVSKGGMLANASVDAMTVALGARGVYLTAKRRYMSYGYDEATADKKALQDAFVSYNSSQQSSEGAFVASMQMDRTALNTTASTFRNAPMGYQRRVTTGARNIVRMLKPGYKEDMIENTKKQMMEDGLSEGQAQRAAERVFNRQIWHSMMDVANFGYNLPFLWTLGPLVWYMMLGDDNDVKLDNLAETARHGSFGFIEGLTFGGVASEVGNMLVNNLLDKDSDAKDFWDELEKKDLTPLPLISRMSGIIDSFRKGIWVGLNDLSGLIIQSSLGVDPNTASELGVALLDACNGDFGLAKETAFFLMRVLQFPQSQLDQLYIDELGLKGKDISKHSYEDLAKRYAKYKARRGVTLTSEMMSEEELQAIEDRYVKTFENKVKDRLANLDKDELAKNYNHGDTELRKLSAKEYASREGVKEEKFTKKPQADWSERNTRSFKTYQRIRDYADLAEDVILQKKQQTYKDAGADEKAKLIGDIRSELDKIRDGRDASEELPQVKGLGEGDDQKVMENLREARRQVIEDLKSGDLEKAYDNLKKKTRELGLRGEDKKKK